MWGVEKETGAVFYKNDVIGHLGSSEILLLSRMLEEPFRVFTKDELLDIGWPGRVVAPNSLTVAIKNIRKIFGYRPSELSIKTKHGYGYALHLPIEDEVIIVDQHLAPELDEKEIAKDDKEISYVIERAESIEEQIPRYDTGQKKQSFLELLKLLSMVGTFFILLVLNVVISIYDKKVYCETINDVTFCGSRPLAYSERLRLQNGQFDIDERVGKYVYGYNYTTQNMVYYPLR